MVEVDAVVFPKQIVNQRNKNFISNFTNPLIDHETKLLVSEYKENVILHE